MKKFISIILSIIAVTSTTAFAAKIPRESAPDSATKHQIQITENPISGILDNVQNGESYGSASCKANNAIRKAVMSNQADDYGYGILSAISQNAIRITCDKMLRPEVYRQYEEYLKVLLADILTDVRNGRDLENVRKAAYEQIYQSVNPSFNYDKQFLLDICYHNIPVVDAAMFTVARQLIIENRP